MFQMIHFIGLSSTICLMSLLCRVSFRLLNTAFSSEIHFANGMYIDSFSCLVTPEMKYFLSKGNRLRYIIMRNLIILINVRLNNYFANLISYYCGNVGLFTHKLKSKFKVLNNGLHVYMCIYVCINISLCLHASYPIKNKKSMDTTNRRRRRRKIKLFTKLTNSEHFANI